MKICIFTNHFYPENFKVNDIAFELQKKGFEISIITAIPDYPQGKFYTGYGYTKKNNEVVNGCKVYRLPIIPRGKGKPIQLILNYLSYYFSSKIFIRKHCRDNEYDAIFVHLTSPIFISSAAVYLKDKQKIPLIFWTLDLWPESLTAAANIKNTFILNPQIKYVKKIYTKCDKILIGSKGFEKSICEKGDFKDKLIYFPNWAEEVTYNKQFDISKISPFDKMTSEDFIILFTGNIGESQNLDKILEVAFSLKQNKHIKFVFVGDGRAKEKLLSKAVKVNILNENVFFTGRYPIETMPNFISKANLLLVSLKDKDIFNLTVPAKIQFYMSQGKPIIGMLNGDGAELIKTAECGLVSNVDDIELFKENILKLSMTSKEELNAMGERGLKFFSENFRKTDRINQLVNLFRNIKY